MSVSKSLFEKIRSYVVMVSQDGEILLANQSFAQLSGVKDISNIEGQLVWEFMKPYHKGARKTELVLKRRILLKNKHSFQFETLLNVNHLEKYILWDLSVDEGNRYLLIGNDITERKKAEQQLKLKNSKLLEGQRDFLDSVNYAKKLQQAILPNNNKIKEYLGDAFVFYKPKDIVSGDAYWMSRTEHHIFVAAIDCTGHGIPGAMLTVLSNNLLREIVVKRKVYDPGEILNQLDAELAATFNSEENSTQTLDGMDIALIRFDKGSNELKFASAFRPISVIRDNNYIEMKGERYPIGLLEGITKKFNTQSFLLKEKDNIYLYSDGYTDQFGGPKIAQGGKKFSKRKWRELLLSITDLKMKEQLEFLDYAHNNWKQEIPQTDDIVVIGIEYFVEKLVFKHN